MKNRFKKERYIVQLYSDRSNSWSFQVRIRSDGFDYVKTFSEKKFGSAKAAYDQAIIDRNKVLYEMNDRSYTQKKDVSLEQCFYESLDLFNYRHKTRRNHISMFHRFIDTDMALEDLDNVFVMKCLNRMSATCSDDLIARVYCLFKDIDRTALYKGYYKYSHVNYIKLPQSQIIQSLANERITDKQTLIDVVSILQDKICNPYEKQQYSNFLWTMYYTGCRPGEVFALEKTDIRNGWIFITKEVGSSTEKGNCIRPPKTKESSRKIPIAEELKSILKSAADLSSCELLFPNLQGSHYNSNTVSTRINHCLKGTGISFSCYMLRHLFQTDLKYSGVDDKTIDVLVGHTNKKTLDVYIHTNDKRLQNAILIRKECVHSSTF